MEHEKSHPEADFGLLIAQIPDYAFFMLDPTGHVSNWNVGAERLKGYCAQEIIGRHFSVFYTAEDLAVGKPDKALAIALSKGTYEEEGWRVRKDGTRFWAAVTITVLRDPDGMLRGFVKLTRDMTERKRFEDALRQSEERFRLLFENAPIGIAECTLEDKFIQVNPKLLNMLGYTREEFAGLSAAAITHPAERGDMQAKREQLLAGKVASYSAERRLIRKDGSFVWVDVSVALRCDTRTGMPQSSISIVEDITARKRTEEHLRRALEQSHYLASHDTLTGLASRAEFSDRQKDALAYAQRDGHLIAIHLLDLDRFKSINDTLGHHAGDLLLKEVARRIKSHIRATDLAARLGGDEFGVIQTHLTEIEAAGLLADKLVEELRRPYLLEGQEVHSGASIGIACYPRDGQNPEQLSKLADLALYEAKNRGRYNYQFYCPEIGAVVRKTRELEEQLERALHEDQFRLHYQPQFDLRNGRITAIEALLRWQNPKRGLIAAAEFIREAEDSCLMLALEEWTLLTACRQHKDWLARGLSVPLTINASSKQLRHPRFLKTLKKILAETGFDPALLQLEIQESVLMDTKIHKNTLNGLRELGVRLSLDDFGTDFIAFSCLRAYSLDVVKLAYGLVRKLPTQQPETAIAAAIIDVARSLGITVCAEGVETSDQPVFLKAHGCFAAQGYLLASPVDAGATTRLVEQDLMAFSEGL